MNNRSGKKSLVEMKREMQQNVYGQKDKPKFEINPRPAPGSENSALPATRAVVVKETSLGDLTQPLAKRYVFLTHRRAESFFRVKSCF